MLSSGGLRDTANPNGQPLSAPLPNPNFLLGAALNGDLSMLARVSHREDKICPIQDSWRGNRCRLRDGAERFKWIKGKKLAENRNFRAFSSRPGAGCV